MDITTMLYRIDCLVKAKGWTKEEFYAMVPISSSAVAQWKSKGCVPKDVNILRMAEILEVDPDYLRCKDFNESTKPADLSTNELHAALMNFDMNFDMKNQPRCRSWFSLFTFLTPPHRFPPGTRHGGLLMGHQYVNVFSYYAHI